jgi:hypothetical protein
MTQLSRVVLMALAFVVLTAAVRTDPNKQVIPIRSNDVTLRADPDTTLAAYYTVSYSPPGNLPAADLQRAILELYVDVGAKSREDYVNEAPVLEVYALTEPFSDVLDREDLDQASRVVQPVAAGDGRHVVIDVTRIVRSHLDGRLSNNGLVMGSVTGMREGEFVFVPGRLPGGAVAQVHVYRRHEFVPVEVPSEVTGRTRQ